MIRCLFAAGAVLSFAGIAAAQDRPIAFVGGRIIPIEGDAFDNGVLIVQGGKIVAVGPAGSTRFPDDAQRMDASGQTIMPGLVDTHNHNGGIGGGDGSASIQPDIRIYDSLNPMDTGFPRVVAGGLTAINVMPGSGHLLSGQTIYLKMRGGRTIDDIMIHDAEGKPMGGMKMANGTNSQRQPPFPGTRAKSAALVRGKLIKAQEYRDKIARADGDPEKMPARDLAMEGLVEALEGKRIVHHHTHRADDIITVLRLAKEFGFRVVLHHVSEGWKVAHEIAEAKAPCSVIVIDAPGGKLEAVNLTFKTGAVLEKAGALVAFHTDDWITDSRLFFRSAALAVRAGMSREEALRALTINGAQMMDLQDRVGSLEVGKDADFIILDGDPLSTYTKVLQTWVEGKKVFDRSNPDDYLHAVGGYGAGHDTEPWFCCFEDSDQ